MSTVQTYQMPSYHAKIILQGILVLPEKPIAMLEISHGMAEHIERYLPFMEYLAEQGILVFGHNHIGHGGSVASEKDLGYMPWKDGVDTLVSDVLADGKRMKASYPQLPLFLLGHSMGSFVARLAAACDTDGQYDAFVVMGTGAKNPAANLGLGLLHLSSAILGERHISKLLYALIFGSYNKRCEKRTEFDWLSRDPNQVDRYIADPLSGFSFTVSALGVLTRLNKAANSAETFASTRSTMPILMVSGAEDPVGGYAEGVKTVYEAYHAAGCRNITLQLYNGGRHEILNETNKDEVFADIAAWLNKQIRRDT